MNLIQVTNDGSSTFYSSKFNESYHSNHGAISESLHVFIKNGINFFDSKKSLRILEVGFGTGLNTLLTLFNSSTRVIDYQSVEKYPLTIDNLTQFKLTLEPSLQSV